MVLPDPLLPMISILTGLGELTAARNTARIDGVMVPDRSRTSSDVLIMLWRCITAEVCSDIDVIANR